ncbi:Baculovirus F protein [Popillia japonica]|uniref:Baculovirus F protein n=1 Tax=Popillia japonica TaxID=7064 RepID=A0AAW1L9N0_POPJA
MPTCVKRVTDRQRYGTDTGTDFAGVCVKAPLGFSTSYTPSSLAAGQAWNYFADEEHSSTSSSEVSLQSKIRTIEPKPGPSSRPDSPEYNSSDDSDSTVIFPSRNDYVVWRDVSASDKLNEFVFSGKPVFRQEEIDRLKGHNPIDFFLLFFDEEVQHLLVTETNRYAEQKTLNVWEDETENAREDAENVLVKLLKEKRFGDTTSEKPTRKKRLDVIPGRSVATSSDRQFSSLGSLANGSVSLPTNPLIQETTFNLFKLVPLPIKQPSLNSYIFILPAINYLAVDETKNFYFSLKTLNDCHALDTTLMLCTSSEPIYSSHIRQICEIELLFPINEIPKTCYFRILTNNLVIWHKLANKNEWIHVLPKVTDVTINCKSPYDGYSIKHTTLTACLTSPS